MAQRRHHYDRAFEAYLRSRRIPYVNVDEARKALLPEHTPTTLRITPPLAAAERATALKSFDFVIYGEGRNYLVDVKGRRIARRTLAVRSATGAVQAVPERTRLESWVTQDDIDSLRAWTRLFGAGFDAAFLFVYWCEEQPPDSLFQEIFDYQGRWYALRAITIKDYAEHMKTRSPRWRTVDLPAAAFAEVSQPFAPAWLASVG